MILTLQRAAFRSGQVLNKRLHSIARPGRAFTPIHNQGWQGDSRPPFSRQRFT